MVDVMYDLPSKKGVKKVVVTRESIEKSKLPKLEFDNAETA